MAVVRLSIGTMGMAVAGGSVAAGAVVEAGGAVVEGMAAEVMVAVLIPDIGPVISTIFVGIATTMQDVVVVRRWAGLRFPAAARM